MKNVDMININEIKNIKNYQCFLKISQIILMLFIEYEFVNSFFKNNKFISYLFYILNFYLLFIFYCPFKLRYYIKT